jgi:uncharacterized flavoprotein (TIGR03862 family)
MRNIAIIGAGPSGLIAAEILAAKGQRITIYDRMPNAGRKFLMAGRGGLNLTHSEPLDDFLKRYGEAENWLAPHIKNFPPAKLREWCEGLGQETFVGSSGRVFPTAMKAAPLLRAWLKRLDALGVRFAPHHLWQGWENGALKFLDAQNEKVLVTPDATLLALGGASWPRLGADGGWVKILADEGVEISPLRPANCGFIAEWSEHFSSRFAGTPLKSVTISYGEKSAQGEVMITKNGVEGGAVYAISAVLREAILAQGKITIHLDLRPNMSVDALVKKLQKPRGADSLSNALRKAGFAPNAVGLLREGLPPEQLANATPEILAQKFKAMPITLTATAGLARAISTAGGITRAALTDDFMLVAKPNVYACGEMLNWEAPTGGSLLQACFSTGVAAAEGILNSIFTPRA